MYSLPRHDSLEIGDIDLEVLVGTEHLMPALSDPTRLMGLPFTNVAKCCFDIHET
jgi:hypothetical protein